MFSFTCFLGHGVSLYSNRKVTMTLGFYCCDKVMNLWRIHTYSHTASIHDCLTQSLWTYGKEQHHGECTCDRKTVHLIYAQSEKRAENLIYFSRKSLSLTYFLQLNAIMSYGQRFQYMNTWGMFMILTITMSSIAFLKYQQHWADIDTTFCTYKNIIAHKCESVDASFMTLPSWRPLDFI